VDLVSKHYNTKAAKKREIPTPVGNQNQVVQSVFRHFADRNQLLVMHKYNNM
jgi:hypothetical protein